MVVDTGKQLSSINKTLEKQNEIMQQMLDTMPRPTSKFIRVLEIVVLFISVFGFISIADIVIKWVVGG